jgi:hypothetical protein
MTSRPLHRLLCVSLLAGLLSASGCLAGVATTATVSADVSPSVSVVALQPGVWVVEDYSQPVFYSNNVYWMYDGGVWYQTSVWGGGWTAVSIATVPVAVRRIDRPTRYVRYRAAPAARRRYVRQERRDHRREVRQDRREQRREVRQEQRDHRRDVRQEQRGQRREQRQDQRDHRREQRQERHEERRQDRRERRDHRRPH